MRRSEKRSGLMVSALDSALGGPGSRPGQDYAMCSKRRHSALTVPLHIVMVKTIKRKKSQKRQKKRLDRTILIDNHAKFSQVIDHSDQSFLNVDHDKSPYP